MAEVSAVYEFQFKELEKFQMFTDAPGAPGKRSRLIFSSYRGNPRITVFTSVPNDTHKGIISAPMNPETFLVLCDLMDKVIANPAEDKYKISCNTLPKAVDGQRSQEQIHLSDVVFGRNSNGNVWISVIAENRPKIMFEFKISDFHKIFKANGDALAASEASNLQATAMIGALRLVMRNHSSDLKPPYTPGTKPADESKPAKAVNTAGFDDITF